MSIKKTTLLIVDDRSSSRYLGLVLRRMGFSVVYADSAADVITLYKGVPLGIMLINADMSLPSGTGTLIEIRRNPEFAMTPVIMLSSRLDAGIMKRCADAGAHGFLSWPIQIDELYGILQDFVFGLSGLRRKYMRVNAMVDVTVYGGGRSRRYITESVSEGGVYLRTDEPFTAGTELTVSFPYQGGFLRVSGRVIFVGKGYREGASLPPGMAVEFTGLRMDESRALTRLVEELMAGDLGESSGGGVLLYERDEQDGKRRQLGTG